MPYSYSTKNFAEDEGSRNDDQYISAQRDDKRRGSLSQTLQCAAGSNRYCGNQEAGADDTESCFSCKDSFGIGGKQSHQLSGNCQADNGSDNHNDAAHGKRYHIDFFHTFVFSCSIVISDHRAHTLDDSAGRKIEEGLKERFAEFDSNAEYNQLKVISAMQQCRVNESCFNYASGYGYNDQGRDTLEEVYAAAFHTEAALVRPQITCGTHALALALSANLRPGDELLSPVGKPYDTLEEVIGIRQSKGSLAEYGVTYKQVDLLEDGYFDYPAIEKA